VGGSTGLASGTDGPRADPGLRMDQCRDRASGRGHAHSPRF